MFNCAAKTAGVKLAAAGLALGIMAGTQAAEATCFPIGGARLVFADCTEPAEPNRWPSGVSLSFTLYRGACCSAGGMTKCGCAYPFPGALLLEARPTGRQVPGKFVLSRTGCRHRRFTFDGSLPPGDYLLRGTAAGHVLANWPITVVEPDTVGRVPLRPDPFGQGLTCTEDPAPIPVPAPVPAAASPPPSPRRSAGGCAGCDAAGSAVGAALILLGVVVVPDRSRRRLT